MEPTASVPHEEETIRELKSSALEAVAYLTAVLEGGDPKEVLLAQRRITAAFGGVPNLAEQIDRGTGTQLAMLREGASSARPNRACPSLQERSKK